MTVQELIDELNKIEDKSKEIFFLDSYEDAYPINTTGEFGHNIYMES